MPPPANGIITLTSDFGTRDSYLGAMKGAALAVNPEAVLVDLCHQIDPGDLEAASMILAEASTPFPAGTVHLCVVDPSVGTGRRALAIQAGDCYFIGPDNGVFTDVIRGRGLRDAVVLTNSEHYRGSVSSTFHGRDIFAPVAAVLSAGGALKDLGEPINDPVLLEIPEAQRSDSGIDGHVRRIDRFGNLITDIPAAMLADAGQLGEIHIHVKGHTINGLTDCYMDAATGTLVALMGSSGLLEIAVSCGDAATVLGSRKGDAVTVSAD